MGRGHYGIRFEGGHYTEITDLADTLTHASQELEKTDMYQKDLIANVSHDLRTPLTMIQSYAEMIRDLSGNIPEKREAHLNVIIEETHRLNTLVTDMLNLSRMQNRSIQLEREDFDIYETAKSLLASYDLLCEQEGYKIQFNAMAPLWVNGDEARIKQVLSNLINNAVKFCGEDKEIIINLKRIGRKVRCEVIDHGKGIAPDEINHVWERYYKSSTHHVRPTDGTGLGLSIVKEILTLHKANYGVSSKLGKGSIFWFEMELVKAKK
jgi:signal transduction histidine kinase